MGNNNVIDVTNVTKTYGTHKAVDNLTFSVERGEIMAFLGPNGAGKTTTMRMILDILKPDKGSIRVLGEPISESIKDRIGYMPEERGLYRNVQLVDLLGYLGSLKGMNPGDAKKRAGDLLDRVELGEYKNSKVNELSKGMQQKVQFIATILHQPEVLIVDEPFSGLDPVNTQVLKDMLFDLSAQGTTILMSTHMMHQVEEMGDRLLMINHGECVLYGPVQEVRQDFASNAIVVEGTGDWAALPGVATVDVDDTGRIYTLQLGDDANGESVMQAIATSSAHSLTSFSLAVPSLHDIFIAVAGGNNNHA